MDKEKKLIWKFFIEQKLKEIGITLSIIIISTIIPYFLGKIYGDLFNFDIEGIFIGYWVAGIMLLLIICMFLLSLLIVLLGIYKWIKSNWDMAKQRAKKEVRRNDKRTKNKSR